MAARKRQNRIEAMKAAQKMNAKAVIKPEDPVDIQYLNWLADARESNVGFALPHDKALRYRRNGWIEENPNDKTGSMLYVITINALAALKEVLDVRPEPDPKV